MRGAHAARAILLMISCGAAPFAAADPLTVRPALTEHGPAKMPSGMANLCARLPEYCASGALAARHAIGIGPHEEAVLSQVNASVNHRIVSTTDRELYGRDEYWTLPATAGDCEDYVLLKRQTLLALGFAQEALLITVVHDENGEAHAVMTVPTARGDVVLDNRRDEVLPWWQTGYTFIKRQSATDPLRWVSLGSERLQATNVASGPGLP